jgi:hypothetical protein
MNTKRYEQLKEKLLVLSSEKKTNALSFIWGFISTAEVLDKEITPSEATKLLDETLKRFTE